MKKLFLILALIIFCMPAFAHNTEPIRDELLDPKMYGDINENGVFKLHIYEQGKYKYIPIKDELIDEAFIYNASKYPIIKKEHPDDLFFEKIIDSSKVRKILPKTKYDFSKKQIPVQIQLAEQIKTKGLLEGAIVHFTSTHDFDINGKKFKKGTTVLGRVETLSASDKMGVPEIIGSTTVNRAIMNFLKSDSKEKKDAAYKTIDKYLELIAKKNYKYQKGYTIEDYLQDLRLKFIELTSS